jgi:hypothetical protein
MANIDEYKTLKFKEGIDILQSQKQSRLEMAVSVETDIMDRKAFDQLADDQELDERVGRNTDTPISEADHRRRWIYTRDFEKAYLVDREDQIRQLNDPINPYTRNFVSMANRRKDRLVIEAFDATAITGRNGTGTAAFDTAFSIAHGGVNMTTDKIKDAHQMLVQAENEDTELYMAISADQETALLNETEITSGDFNTQRVLVNGRLDTWYGFKFIRTELLPLISTVRTCFAWCKSGMKLGIGASDLTRVEQRADKGYSTQAYAKRHYGAVRMNEKAVVRIFCQQ